MRKRLEKLRLKLFGLFFKGKLSFDGKYRKIALRTRTVFFPFYELHSESLIELLKVKDELIKEAQKNYDKNFNEVTLFLLSRSIQNLESIFILTERGLYGSAFGLLRNVLSDMNMFLYLHYNPNLITAFMQETQTSYQEDINFKSSFNEGAIDEDLKKRGVKSIKQGLQVLSKTMHASVWGSQLYGTEGKIINGRLNFHAKYEPGFETKKALALLNIILSAHLDYLCMILDHRYENKLDIQSKFWKDIIKRIRELEPKILSLSDLGENMIAKMDLRKKDSAQPDQKAKT